MTECRAMTILTRTRVLVMNHTYVGCVGSAKISSKAFYD